MARDHQPAAPKGAPAMPFTSKKSVTIQEVAREAGVAASTVSRALNNPDRVSQKTRVHVQAVAARLGYRTNLIARALWTRRTQTIGLLVPDITNPFFFDLIRGAERQAAAAGFTVILLETEETPEQEPRLLDRLSGAVDGFVLASARMPQEQVQRLAAEHRIVVINRQVPGVASVVIDPGEGAQQAVHHLASLGHMSLTYLAGPRSSWSDARRWRALRSSTRRLGMSATRLGPFKPAKDWGAAAADAALAHRATGIVAFNDLLAIGVLIRLAERGVSVPAEISVVGWDDIFGADFCTPPLTTLAAPIEDAGRTAVRLLLEMLDRDVPAPPSEVILQSRLQIRSSTGQAAN